MAKKVVKKEIKKQPKRRINYFALFAVIIMVLGTLLPMLATFFQ